MTLTNRRATAALFAMSVTALSGCATIMDGSTQAMTIASSPPGAAVLKDGANVGTTPVTLTLRRKENPNFVLKQSGYHDHAFSPEKKVNGWVFGNIVLGGLIGLAVDGINGNISEFDQENYVVNLNPIPGALAQPAQGQQAVAGSTVLQFMHGNSEQLIGDMANGGGPTLNQFYSVIGVSYGQESVALSTLRRQYGAATSDSDFANRVALAFSAPDAAPPPVPQAAYSPPIQPEPEVEKASRPSSRR